MNNANGKAGNDVGPGGRPDAPGNLRLATTIVALGITQIIAWGTTFYALGVLARPIMSDTGWSRSLVFAGLSAALLAAGTVSAWVGRTIDRRGALGIMSAGSVLMAVVLVAVSMATSPVAYIASWVALGVAMRMCLYDAAFAAVVQAAPGRGRRAISYLTLFGGFASTVFWPIGHALNEAVGWRQTFLIYAALNLLVCLPLHALALRRRQTPVDATQNMDTPQPTISEDPTASTLKGRERSFALVLFATVMSLNGIIFSALSAHLVTLLQTKGLAAGLAVGVASLVGVAQVGGRLTEVVFGRRLAALNLARLAVALLPLACLILLMPELGYQMAVVFAITYGVSNGLVTIVRGAVPLALFGAEGYGLILGIIATPILVMGALAPMAFALLIDFAGSTFAVAALLIGALASLTCVQVLARRFARYQSVTD